MVTKMNTVSTYNISIRKFFILDTFPFLLQRLNL
nr:MAG TPA: hypothetical protein [Caudoviricetes sp.]